jgi:hypothetical protein
MDTWYSSFLIFALQKEIKKAQYITAPQDYTIINKWMYIQSVRQFITTQTKAAGLLILHFLNYNPYRMTDIHTLPNIS